MNEDQRTLDKISQINEMLSVIANDKHRIECLRFVTLALISLMRLKIKNEKPVELKLEYGECLHWIKIYGWFFYGALTKKVFNQWGLKDGRDFIRTIEFLTEKNIFSKDSFQSKFSISYVSSNFNFKEYESQDFFDSYSNI